MQVGTGTSFERHIVATWPHTVRLGRHCVIEDGVTFKADGRCAESTKIVLGDNIFVGRGTEINSGSAVTIGDHALITSGCKIVDHNHGTQPDRTIREQTLEYGPIHIGRHTWIGANAVILQSVSIGDGAIIAAGAVVTKSVPENEIWGGIPAKRIRLRATP